MKEINCVSKALEKLISVISVFSASEDEANFYTGDAKQTIPIALALEKLAMAAIKLTDWTSGDISDLEKFFEALGVLRSNVKELQALLQEEETTPVEIKVNDTDIDIENKGWVPSRELLASIEREAALRSLLERARPFLEACKAMGVNSLREMSFADEPAKYQASLVKLRELEQLLEDMK